MYGKETYSILCGNLKYLRLKTGFTQEQVSGLLHCDTETYSQYEKGRTIPNIQILQRLCTIYNISLQRFLEDDLRLEEEFPSSDIDQKIGIYLKQLNRHEKEKVLKYLRRIEKGRK